MGTHHVESLVQFSQQTPTIYRVGQKTGPFLNVDNFAMVGGRKACDMSKVCKFCLEKIIKLAQQCVQIFFA